MLRVRTASPAHTTTVSPPRTVAGPTSSWKRKAAQVMPITGCTSWIWLTCAIGPIARPRYQAKNPRNMLTAARYANASQAVGVATGGAATPAATAIASMTGAASTSAQEMVCHAPSSRASRPPSA